MVLPAHLEHEPVIDDSAVIVTTAVVSDDAYIGPKTVVLAGAVITSQGAPRLSLKLFLGY